MKKIYMIGNTHYDPVWLWKWDEALSSITATFRSALARMEETPDFCYSFSAPAVLEQIEKTNPALFAEISKRVAEGRWDLAEGWWLQADTNAPMGESLVRQGLYGQLYLKEKFGKVSCGAFNIDSFGHASNLPQILSGCGIDYYAFWRPNEAQYSLKSPLFRWKGAADSEVLTYRVGGEGGDIFTEDFEKETLEPVVNSTTDCDLMVVFGVTDHGGAPTKAEIASIQAYRETYKDKVDIRFGTVEEYFASQNGNDIEEITGEIPVTFIGPYSNLTQIKQNNRAAEYSVLNAEKVSVIQEQIFKEDYPKEVISRAWKDILFNQFHDILGGCCIEDAYFDARNLHGRSLQNTDEIVTYGLQKITNQIQMPGKNPDTEWNLVVWNLNGTPFDGYLEAEAQWAWEFPWYKGEIVLKDAAGKEYPCQIIREKSVVPGFRSRFVFHAEIPALGYKSFIVQKTEKPHEHHKPVPQETVQNERYALAVRDGKVMLSEHGTCISRSFCTPYVMRDICDTWGFNKTVYESEKEYLTPELCELTEQGDVVTVWKTVWRYHHSKVEIRYALYPDRIGVSYRALWQEEGCALKLDMALEGEHVQCCAAGPYSEDVREEMEFERSMGEYISLRSDIYELHTVTNSTFAYRFTDGAAGLTVLRNCIYGDLRTEELQKADYRYMGQGETSGKLCVFTAAPENLLQAAMAHNNPPRILLEANHDGSLPCENSYLSCSEPALTVTVIKQAEADNSTVIRVFNPGRDTKSGEISLFDRRGTVTLKPYEIMTLKWQDDMWKRVNMLEEIAYE